MTGLVTSQWTRLCPLSLSLGLREQVGVLTSEPLHGVGGWRRGRDTFLKIQAQIITRIIGFSHLSMEETEAREAAFVRTHQLRVERA